MEYQPFRRTLSYEEQETLRQRFPKEIELSLDTYLPGKVHSDIYEVLPVGKPAFLWFTFFENSHASFVVTKSQRGYKFDIMSSCFTDEIAYGSIVSGIYTIRSKENGAHHSFFCADDIMLYKGHNISHLSIGLRLKTLAKMFDTKDIGNLSYMDNVITICMPIMTNDFTVAQGYLSTLPYPTYGIKMLKMKETRATGVLASANNKGTIHSDIKNVFLVKANNEPDSYTLYAKSNNGKKDTLTEVGLALIPSYVDSVRMNLLFRNIRENISIDYIEESEDEEDFENISPNKYLMEGAEHKMNCQFIKTMNRWVPESIANTDAQLSFAPELKKYHISHTHYDVNNQKNGNIMRKHNHYNNRDNMRTNRQWSNNWNPRNGVDKQVTTRRTMYRPSSQYTNTTNIKSFANNNRRPLFSVKRSTPITSY